MKKVALVVFPMMLCVLLVCSCATKIQGLVADPSFNYGTVMHGGIAVGGVVSSVEQLPAAERSRYAGYFRRAFMDKAPKLPLVTSGHVATQMGQANYQQMLDYFRINATLSPEILKQAKDANVGAAYIALARIDMDSVTYSDEQTESQVEDSKGKKKTQYTLTYRTKREMSVYVSIFDLAQGRSVWSGSVDKSDEDSNSETMSKDMMNAKLIADVAITAIDASSGNKGQRSKYPTPPSKDKLLQRVFNGFGENMPNEKSK
jgi:hypothetical protein